MKKRALISVSNKDHVLSFAKGLIDYGYEIISTGGTLKILKDAGVPVTAVDSITGFPEILEGRVKTLHPKIHGGILAKKDHPEHISQLKEQQIQPIDLVAVNLYPFQQTLLKEDATHAEMVENIDIGGPAMLRAAAKNYEHITVIVDPADYEKVLDALKEETLTRSMRKELAAKVFRHTAQYDALIANYFTTITGESFPESYTVTFKKVQDLRYGENPHQEAAFYRDVRNVALSMASVKQLHGKELSYNNIQDANAALEIVSEYEDPAVVAVKHMNPCGIGLGKTLKEAYTKAYEADPISIFGGIVACNRTVDEETAEQLHKIFLEIVIAPDFTEEALQILTEKKNVRLLTLDGDAKEKTKHRITTVHGGILVQDIDEGKIDPVSLEVVTNRKPTEKELEDLLFAWKAVKHVKSNAIVLAKNNQTIGIGAGQMNRVGAAKIAIEQAGDQAKNSVLASDAFFPMPDTVEAAVKAGVTAIIQPGGSVRDRDSIDVCNKHDVAMVFTNMRHFKH